MAVDVGGKTYRTLKDDIFANGNKVYEITVNGNKVYPEDNGELEGNPYIVKFVGHGLLDYPLGVSFRRSGLGQVYMSASYTAHVSFVAVYGFYPPEDESLYSVDDGYDENGRRYFKIDFRDRDRWPKKQFSTKKIFSSVVTLSISKVRTYDTGDVLGSGNWTKFIGTGTSAAANGTHSMDDDYGNAHYESNPRCLYHATGDRLGIDWCRAVVSGVNYPVGQQWQHTPDPINPAAVEFSVDLLHSYGYSGESYTETYTDVELTFTEAVYAVTHSWSAGGFETLSYGYGYYKPYENSDSHPNETKIPITDILYMGMSSDAKYGQSHVSRSDLYR